MKWRDIPHPSYGNYGGGFKTDENFNKLPIDELDMYFKLHDLQLKDSKSKYEEYLVDSTLFLNLMNLNFNNLRHPIYGRVYWFFSVVVFGFIYKFKDPSE